MQRSPDVEFTEGSSVVLTGEDLTQLGDSFSAKFYRDGTLVETYSGNVGPDGSLPLGLVKLKQGTYSVELASGGTTLTPFKAVVKPSTVSTMANNLESDTTFQKLPQSGTEQIETTGNAALPEQIKLVTEDSKSNAGKENIDTATDLPKSENRSLESQRSFLTADQVNGQKSVFDNTSGADNANTTQTKVTGQESPRVRSLAESNLEFPDASGNQPFPDTKDSFSSNQNFINNNLENEQDISSNNALPNSQETISKNAELPSSVSFGLSQDGSPISQNALPNSQETISKNAELPSSVPFGLSQDGSPVSQNAPLGYTPDGVPISQSFDLDKNGLPITQNRPFDGSSEAFSINTPLEDGESQSVVQNENIQLGNSIGPNAEYQRLPEAILANEFGQSENSPSSNATFENFDQQSVAPDKLLGSNFPGGSKNNNFIETDGEIYSENQKLTDSTIFNSRTDVEGANQNQPGEYQQIPEANLNYNLGTNSSGAVSEQYNKAGIEQTQASDQIPDKINQAVGQNNQTVTQGESAGPTYKPVGQADTNEASSQPASLVSTSYDDLINVLGQNISDTNIYQTRTIGATGGSNTPGRESDGIYSGEALGNGELDASQGADSIVPSRILSSSIGRQAPNPQYSNDEVVQAEQQNRQSDYVQEGNTYSTESPAGISQINNFNLDTDLPGDFYEYKGSRNISNEELLDEFLNSEEFKKLDEESKSRVVNVKQEIQAQKNVPTQNQQDSVLSGTVLSGGQPIKDKTREPMGFAKLFTRNKQDRPVDRTQEQIQRQFEESNSLKQKVSLTLNKVFGSNEKSVSISEYTTPDQQLEQLQNSQFEDTDEDILQSDDYQFGDEDNVINRYPRITGARETLDEDYQEELRKRRKKRRNLRYLPVGANLESKFLQASNEQVVDSLPSDEESNIYRGLIGERDRFQNLTISEQEQNKIALRKAEHDIQQQLNKALEENVIIKENAENQAAELSADSETMFYKELLKERERFQQALSEERDQNKAALRRSEEQIQRQLIDVLTSNPQASPAQASNDPISQVVRSLVDSGKDKEEVIIDATRIIQMIQNNQTVAGAQEIDEFLLRQRIERELKYEFKQMQLEHEQKMKLIYRRMIEDMYIDMLNS